jgi:O-succinylbenzoate synthase
VILARVRLWAYALPLARPLAARGAEARERRGFLIEASDAEGRTGWGEAAPLPGHGGETAAAALAGLRRFAGRRGCAVPDGIAALDGRLAGWLGPLALGPAAACAAETALLGLAAARAGLPLHRLLAPDAAEAVAVAGLIDGAVDAVAEARRLVAAGHRVLKLKIGGQEPAAAAARLGAVAAILPPGGALRLDANRCWTAAQAGEALAALAATGAPVAFVEEPVADGTPLPGCPLPLALDETLAGLALPAALAALERPGLGAVVLKPSLLGFEAAARIGRAARARGLAAVVSSSFESGLGLRTLAALAAAWPQTAAGLGTAGWFAADLVPPAPEPARLAPATAAPDRRLLEPVDG